jgi:FKBP-type peptidyl-prolyl cis-trans isomerase SlyD
MKVEKNKMVSLIYELREASPEGRIIETVEETRPLNFIYGTGRLLPLFESNLLSLGTGDNFSFPLSSADAYGDRTEEMIINVPKSVFMTEDGNLNEDICRVGNEVPMMDNEGHHLNGIINEIAEDYVRMDFNHPMAGVDLYFSGMIVDVREATDQELAGVQGCEGCGSSHGSDCSGCS